MTAKNFSQPPAIWRRYLDELKRCLKNLERELEAAKGDEALKLRTRFDQISKDISRLTA